MCLVRALLFCFSVNHKRNDNSLTLWPAVNVQSAAHYCSARPGMIKPSGLMLSVWQSGPALHRGIHTVVGSLMEPVRGYCLVLCEFKPQLHR